MCWHSSSTQQDRVYVVVNRTDADWEEEQSGKASQGREHREGRSPFVESTSSLKRITGTWELVMVGLLVGTTMLGLEGVETGLGDVYVLGSDTIHR